MARMTVRLMIRTAAQQISVRQAGGYRRWLAQVLDARWPGATPEWEMVGSPVQAWVSASNWVATCDVCSEQIIVEPGIGFYCPGCQNVKNEGKARPILWPSNRAEIEAVLLERPVPATRTWMIGETIEDLKRENEENL